MTAPPQKKTAPRHRALPIVAAADCGAVRPSRRGRWRTAVLTLVYVAFVAHYVHWWVAGRTLTPVEPSEAMQTLEQGLINAGFVLFALAILSTLLLGRWFCGWGCHIIALQDLCTWLLKRAGLRPQPLRSRLLVFVPLFAALYMFVWPSVVRAARGVSLPPVVAHFMTYDFWATFPGPAMTVFTLLACGFAAVYLLGNKGFCTYACPYGGFFGLADRVAPGRIRVTDACDGCGHCTAACTSNVRVHEEVRRFGMVVDPGCMKCTDCISVCPKEALYFGFGRAAVTARAVEAPRHAPRAHYAWPEELALAVAFLGSLYALRGLYDAVPFLLALGLSSICAFLLAQAMRLLYTPALQLRGVQLRRGGRLTRAGQAYAAAALLLVVFLGHAALLQYHAAEGERLLDEAGRLQTTAGPDDAKVRAATEASLPHLRWVTRYGLCGTPRVESQLATGLLFLGRDAEARAHAQRALRLRPSFGAARYTLAELVARAGDLPTAVDQLGQALRDDPSLADARRDLIAASERLGRLAQARDVLTHVVQRREFDPLAHVDLALVLTALGETDAALHELDAARRLTPLNPGVLRIWAAVLAKSDKLDEALQQRASASPGDVIAHYESAFLYAVAGDAQAASTALQTARSVRPDLAAP